MYQEMTEKIKFKAANPSKIIKYHHYAQGAMLPYLFYLIVMRSKNERVEKSVFLELFCAVLIFSAQIRTCDITHLHKLKHSVACFILACAKM